ncbi:hypothetical protein JANAI62_20010 [Jannaschia pagri]|uniref:Uncharacterized protein n=1 Tax=Jannaschia pagri TaxID=2829797 RepID=A0ABQ4NLU0_9RHOB|nr:MULTISPECIES: hypothetical protein [unclassified Jannaschia]GIT91544.1 hypothetical protein JANAI61_20020 [Jannaschia sp. AI_61]GIT95378.1 hypothetical protein JANAI62_20010 [Jannaschia sp. AI_62]
MAHEMGTISLDVIEVETTSRDNPAGIAAFDNSIIGTFAGHLPISLSNKLPPLQAWTPVSGTLLTLHYRRRDNWGQANTPYAQLLLRRLGLHPLAQGA